MTMDPRDQSSQGHKAPAVSKWWMVLVLSLLLPQSSFAIVEKPPKILKDLNQHMQLTVGDMNRFVLECRGDAEPAPTYRWFRNSELLTKELQKQLNISETHDGEHSELHFNSPILEHEGYYQCEAENDLGTARSSSTFISPAFPSPPPGTEPPEFEEAPKNNLKSLGSRVELVCRASGKPRPDITWTKNGKIQDIKTDTFIIPSLGEDDVANYACNASNIAGYKYKDVILSILTETPRITEGPKPLHVGSNGSTITLKCEAEGYPEPVITWTKDGQPLVEDGRFHVDSQTGDLTVSRATEEDDGRYECRAKSNNGEATAAGYLEIKSVTTIVNGPGEVTKTVGDTIVMKCDVVAGGDLDLKVTWKKDNLDIELNDRIQQNEDHSLTIQNLTFDDSDLYTCVARTTVDKDTATGHLTVKGVKPLLVPMDDIEELESFMKVLEGGSLSLPCKLKEGFPSPTVIWYKDGTEVDQSRVRVEEDNTLELGPLTMEDDGEYVCLANNEEGKSRIDVYVEVNKKIEVVSPILHVDFKTESGEDVFFPCEVSSSVDNVKWYKDLEELDVYKIQPDLSICQGEVECTKTIYNICEISEDYRLYQLLNNSLVVCGLQQVDVGSYYCEVSNELELSVKSQYHSVYIQSSFPWWIILVIIIAVLVLILLGVLAYCWRKKTQGKGYYGMDVEDAGLRNKSDIYYTTEDNESIMDEVDQSMLEKQNGKTPIFTPKTIRRLARVDKSIGSIGSLLDDDEYLDKGYDEDGSFRERYAE